MGKFERGRGNRIVPEFFTTRDPFRPSEPVTVNEFVDGMRTQAEIDAEAAAEKAAEQQAQQFSELPQSTQKAVKFLESLE